MRIRDPKPEIQRLEQLVDAIRNGEIRLPKFQRPFVWQKKDVLNLFDSIYNGYPIGSILLWHSSERLSSEREIIGFKFSESNSDKYPTDYLLDGQQRLTSLCATLFWEGHDPSSIWNIYFDLDNDCFVYPKDGDKISLYPMNKLLSTKDFIKQCMKFEHSNNATNYYEKAEQLLKSFKDYKIAVVKIGDVGLDEVAPIFERINSTGRKLTMVDLMRAATWKNGFDLSKSIENITDEFKDTFGLIPDTLVLRIIAASANLGVSKSDIDKLRSKSSEELENAINDTLNALKISINFLNKYASVSHISFLPYSLQLIFITEYFRLNTEPSIKDELELSAWFWRTSFARYFGGASTGQISRDLVNIRRFATHEVNTIEYSDLPIDFKPILFDEFNLRTASSKVFALLLKRNIANTDLALNNIELDRTLFREAFKGYNGHQGKNITQVLYSNKQAPIPADIYELNYFTNWPSDYVDDVWIDTVIETRESTLVTVALELANLNYFREYDSP